MPRIQKLGAAVGRKGVGKTFFSTNYLRTKYIVGNPATGRNPRKVLIMDINDEYDRSIRAISPDDVKLWSALPVIEMRRIRPIDPKTGSTMTLTQYADVLFRVLEDFRGGLLLLEDINRYISDNMPNDLIGAICTNRHKDCDVLIHYQSIGRIQTKVWQNINYLRFHKSTDSVSRHENKFPEKFEMMLIAEILVNKMYETDQRFCLYVDIDEDKIRTDVTPELKTWAINEYIEEYDQRNIKRLIGRTDDSGKKKYDAGTARVMRREQLFRAYF